MNLALSLLLAIMAGLAAIPALWLLVEVAAAAAAPASPPRPHCKGRRPRLGVLVPAHDEAAGLPEVLSNIQAQLRAGDRLLVVADNCTDDTAVIARTAGAEVTERNNPALIGKGYALAWGLRHFERDPPELVTVVDADCRLGDDALEQMAAAGAQTKRPIQARYCMTAPPQSPVDYSVATFAFRVKNWVRPLGLRTLDLPCQLMGSGMTFPWHAIQSVDLASGCEVEDLKLGADLARQGHPPQFLASATVHSTFPSSTRGAKAQRQRWERGHIRMIAATAPRLLWQACSRRDASLLALAIDLAVPPLTLLGVLSLAMLLLSVSAFLIGSSSVALVISAVGLSAYVTAVLLCWLKFGRDVLPLSAVAAVASYVVSKVPIYRRALRGPAQWVRADRESMTEARQPWNQRLDV
jgi:cellulose synthase/poly-beta-1,6-N-acetylglucosamine synthase-like glycosyltransferase